LPRNRGYTLGKPLPSPDAVKGVDLRPLHCTTI
jgi:hypothetical protein